MENLKTIPDEIKNLNRLSDEALLQKTSALAKAERTISVAVLWHLKEVEMRKAYVPLGHLSLFQYAITELKYSEGAAMRRITAMRALKDCPNLAEKIETGELTVSGVARVQSFIRQNEKDEGVKWTEDEKKDLFQSLESVSQKEIEKRLIEISPESAQIETVRPVTQDLVEIKVYLSSDDLKELNELRGLIAHQLKDGSNSELIKKLVSLSKEWVIQKKTKTAAAENSEDLCCSASTIKTVNGEDGEAFEIPKNRYTPAKIKAFLFRRAELQCEIIDPKTQKRCSSKYKLEIDHKVPHSLGGSNAVDNLRVVCRVHNQYRTRGLKGFVSGKDSRM